MVFPLGIPKVRIRQHDARSPIFEIVFRSRTTPFAVCETVSVPHVGPVPQQITYDVLPRPRQFLAVRPLLGAARELRHGAHAAREGLRADPWP